MLASKNYIQEKEVKWATELAGMCKNHAEKPKRASRKLWPFFSPFSCYLAGNRSKKEDLVNLVTYSLVVAKGYCWREMGVSGNDYVLWYAVMIETEPNPPCGTIFLAP